MISSGTFQSAQSIAKFFYGDDSVDSASQSLGKLKDHMASIGRWDGSHLDLAERSLQANPRDNNAQGIVQNWYFLGRWGALGCPVVRLEPGWDASVCVSNIPEELFGLLTPPWDCFIIDVRPEMGFVFWLGGQSRPMSSLKVRRARACVRSVSGEIVDGWMLVPMTDNGDQRTGNLVLRDDQLFGGIEADSTISEDCLRTLQHLGPLVGATCLAFQNGDKRQVGGTKRSARRKRGGLYPTALEYVVGKPVTVDLTERVARHIRGEGSRLKVQGVVRGHWKNQRHGPGATERKFIHIEPYWRGPEDAPIVVRPYSLKSPPAQVAE